MNKLIKISDGFFIFTFWFGLVFVFLLSLIGYFYPRDSYSTETNCGVNNLEDRISTLLDTSGDHHYKYFIAVVGDGVPSETIVKDRPYNTQYAQGYDMYQGIQQALKLPDFSSIKKTVGILYIDDGGNPSCANKISKILSEHAELLGVIGHSTTSTTNEAIPNYQASNIPFMIPVATNPGLLASHPKNCFRLPSNDKIQALIISDLILEKFSSRNVFIVWDATPEALQYSEYLKANIQNNVNFNHDSLAVILEGLFPISLNPLNYAFLFKRIVSSNTDVIVFCGYGSLAREFLFGLDDEYSHYKSKQRPKVILTDGCKIPGQNGFSFDTYLTFPAEPLKNFNQFKNFEPGKKIPPYQKMYLEESYEVFGYDATLLLMGSVSKLYTTDISRNAIIKEVQKTSGENSLQTCYDYRFEDGENYDNRYFCYSLRADSIVYSYNDTAIRELLKKYK